LDVPTPRRVALYARVSTKDKGQDTENQLAQLRDFCGASGFSITPNTSTASAASNLTAKSLSEMFAAASRR
jgi:predicted site-specific integrase-resolvase